MFIFYIFLLYSFICYNLGKIKNGKNVPNPLRNIFIRLLKLDGVKSYSTFPFLSCKITVLYNVYICVSCQHFYDSAIRHADPDPPTLQ